MTRPNHDPVREALLDQEPDDLTDALKTHYDGCAECRAFHNALFAIDAGLDALPPIEAPLDLIARTRLAIDELPPETRETTPAPAGMMALFGALLSGLFGGVWALLSLLVVPFKTRPRWAIAIPALGALGLVFVVGVGTLTFQAAPETPTVRVLGADPTPRVWLDGQSRDPQMQLAESEEAEEVTLEDAPPRPNDPAPARLEAVLDETGNRGDDANGRAGGRYYWRDSIEEEAQDRLTDTTTAVTGEGYRREGEAVDRGIRIPTGRTGDAIVTTQPFVEVVVDGRTLEEERREVIDVPAGHHRIDLAAAGTAESPDTERTREVAQNIRNGTFRQRLERFGYVGRDEGGEDVLDRDRRLVADRESVDEDRWHAEETGNRFGAVTSPPPQGATFLPRLDRGDFGRAANELALARDRHQGLTFRSPTGYWANTYLPGDPAIRSLRRRLADHPAALQLAELAQPGAPGLSPPRIGALSLDVSADRARVEGRSRVLMSVGLRGAAQRAGRRPSLRVQVVLDLRNRLDDEGEARVRALLSSLSRRRTGTDRVGVLAAGPDGGPRVELGTMRFGEVTVALRRIFGPTPDDASAVSLRASLETALASVGQLDEDAPLGSSMVLLVTPGLSEADSQELARVAHVGALAGVTTTVIGLSDQVALSPLERVALAGQGRRRILARAGGADTLVRDEIAAVSRVVARAVRIRIRLAEGVQLVDVLGSRSLDEAQAQRVRRAEQAIDRALARRLGIMSDRGEDEDGIQIVVPAFYADDSHRVLLDLVVAGPGPVADVQVRWKDLLRLGNGTLTARLVLSRGTAARSPAERAVFAAWLGYELSTALRAAASELEAGQPDAARATLERARLRVVASWDAIPELASEPSLTRDVSLCQRYRDALGAQPADVMARSLRYAAHRRLLGDPLRLGGEP